MSWFSTLLVAAAGALLLFVLAEHTARAWLAARGGYFVWPPYARTRLEYDPEARPALEAVARIEINADGERADPPPAIGASAYRVLVAGASVAECHFLDQDSTWSAVIQRVLNRPENLRRLGVERAHVGNIARPLVTCRHVTHILEKVLPRYARLDAIVVMVGVSDLLSWMERGTPSAFDDSPPSATEVFDWHHEGPFAWTHKRLALRHVAAHARRRWLREGNVCKAAGQRLARAREMRAQATSIIAEVPDPAPLLAHFDLHFRRLLRLAGTRAGRVIIVRQPWFEKQYSVEEARQMWNFGIGRPFSGKVDTYYAHDLVWAVLRKIDQRAAEIARELDVEQIDVMSILPRDLEIFYDELHLTPKGCAIVGEAVAARILAPKPGLGIPS